MNASICHWCFAQFIIFAYFIAFVGELNKLFPPEWQPYLLFLKVYK